MKIDKIKKEVLHRGNVIIINAPLRMIDWDSIFKRVLSKTPFEYSEILYYCSPKLLKGHEDLMEEINAGFKRKEVALGYFENLFNPISLMIDGTFHRGGKDVHLVCKPINYGLIIPIPKSDIIDEESLINNSILIEWR